jgi:hypothetical protein
MERVECGHLFCKNCWIEYLTVTINGGKVTGISFALLNHFNFLLIVLLEVVCPARGCAMLLDELAITKMLGMNTELLLKYQRFVANSYVNVHS